MDQRPGPVNRCAWLLASLGLLAGCAAPSDSWHAVATAGPTADLTTTAVKPPAPPPSPPAAPESEGPEFEQFWLRQRDLFFERSAFVLEPEVRALVQGEQALEGRSSYHLPFWFHYDMFKQLTERNYSDSEPAGLRRHQVYVDNCLRAWKHAALKRLRRPNNFTFIDLAEDWTEEENCSEQWGELGVEQAAGEAGELPPLERALASVQAELAECGRLADRPLCLVLLAELDERFGPPMKLRYPFEGAQRFRGAAALQLAEQAGWEFADSLQSPDGTVAGYWRVRRAHFYRNTSFELGPRARALLTGPELAPAGATGVASSRHLASWFDYELFKLWLTRINDTPQEELKSAHRYAEACVEAWLERSSELLGGLEQEPAGLSAAADVAPRACASAAPSQCNPFDYELTEEESRERPLDRAQRLVLEELEEAAADRRRLLVMLALLDEQLPLPAPLNARDPFEAPAERGAAERAWLEWNRRDRLAQQLVGSLASA